MYHVGVSNIFELLDDENDEEGRKKVVSSTPAKQQAPAPTTKGKVSAAPTGKEAPRKAESTPAAKVSAPPKERIERRPPRPTEDKPRGERPPRRREPRPEGSGAPVGGERSERVERTDKGDRPPRVFEGGRGRRDNKDREFQARPNKRPYDRKSGTGRGKEVKKAGGGRANWGKDEEQWEEVAPAEKREETESKPEGEAKVETETASPATPVASAKEEKQENEEEKKRREEEERKQKEEEEKEAKQMTLDDYLKKKEAEKAEKGTIIPELPAPRKPGEGVDKKDLQMWAKFTALKRDEDEEKNSPTESKKDKKKEPKKQAVPVDQVLNVQQPKKPRPGKPENSDRRRDSPRGGKRRSGAAAPDVKDASSFPALNTKA